MYKKAISTLVFTVILFFSCATEPSPVPEDKSPAELISIALEYGEAGDYINAIAVTEALEERFPEDSASLAAARYNRAIFFEKQGELQQARELLVQILEPTEGEAITPPWVLVLAEKVLERIDVSGDVTTEEE